MNINILRLYLVWFVIWLIFSIFVIAAKRDQRRHGEGIKNLLGAGVGQASGLGNDRWWRVLSEAEDVQFGEGWVEAAEGGEVTDTGEGLEDLLEEVIGEGKGAGGSTQYPYSMTSIFLSVIDGIGASVQFVVSSCQFRCPRGWRPVIRIDVSSR